MMDYAAIDGLLRRYVRHTVRTIADADRAVELEDLAQSAWVRGLPKLRADPAAFPSDRHRAQYLARIARNLALDRERARVAHPQLPLGEWVPVAGDLAEEAENAALAEATMAATHPYLVLNGLGYTFREIGALTGKSTQAVKVKAFRWRQEHAGTGVWG